MAYSYVWPVTLPQVPQKGYSESIGVNILRTPMDAGPAKQRRRGNKPSNLNVAFIMTTAQVALLETFCTSTIKGVARFGFTHPRTKVIEEVRIVPQSEGVLYNLSYLAPEYWTVTLQLEVLA